MIKRIVTASILIPLVVLLIFYAPSHLFAVIISAIAALCMREFAMMFRVPDRVLFPASAALALATIEAGLLYGESGLLSTLAFSMMVILSLTIFGSDEIETKLEKAKIYATGFAYTVLPLSFFPLLRGKGENGALWFLFALVMPWVCDSGAYFFGCRFGKHKMTKVSPNKTWEGTMAGFFTALVGGALFSLVALGGKYMIFAILTAGAATTFGQIGDLVESLFKRGAGVKDSGTLFPGHGGMLDRVDSLLFSVVTVYIALRFL